MTTRRTVQIPRQIQQTAAQGMRTDVEGATRLAIQALQSQIAQVQAAVSQLQIANQTGRSENGYSIINTTTVSLTNKSGAARNSGEVVILDTATDEGFKTTTTAADTAVIGVVAQDSADGTADAIAVDAAGLICTSGVSAVKVNATVAAISPGDCLYAHTTAGVAVKAANAFSPGVFAIALEALASGTDTIDAIIIPIHQRDIFRIEYLTPADDSTVVLSEAPYSSPGLCNPACVVIDTSDNTASFPNSIAGSLPESSRCVLSNTGPTVTNLLGDWTVGAGNLACFYLPASRATTENDLLFFMLCLSFFSQYELLRSITDWTWPGLDTTDKTVQGAINEVKDTSELDAMLWAIALG